MGGGTALWLEVALLSVAYRGDSANQSRVNDPTDGSGMNFACVLRWA